MFKKKDSVNQQTISLYWQASLRNKKLLKLSCLYPVGAICISTLVPLFIGKTIALLAKPHTDHWHYAPELLTAIVVGILANRIGFVAFQRFLAKTLSVLHEQAFGTLLGRSVGFHNNNVSGKLVSEVGDYSNGFLQMANSLFAVLVPFIAVLVVGSVLVFSESLWLGLIVTITAAYALIVGANDSRKRAPLRARRLAAGRAVTAQIADSIVNAQAVKTFGREADELKAHQKLSAVQTGFRYSDWAGAATMGNNRIALLFCFQLIFLVVLTRLVEHNPALLGVGIFSVSFTTTIFNRLFDANIVTRQIEEALLLAEPITQVVMMTPEILDAPEATKLAVKNGDVQFSNVTFAYQDSDNPQTIFEDLSLSIPAGQKVGLVGPSGGGKTTITRLVLRFEDIQQGSITIDGQDIAQVTQNSLRKAIAYVPQEPLLFHRTIAENIAYGKPAAGLKDIKQAADKAFALQFIESLPDGFDTVVGERGVKLSGGQRQRIAIARAILKDAPILVLDEATSALDSESEAAIQKALNQLMQSRTTMVIAHRLSTIQHLDRIIVIEDGKIIEDGSHTKLLKSNGLYARLWQRQSGGFIEED